MNHLIVPRRKLFLAAPALLLSRHADAQIGQVAVVTQKPPGGTPTPAFVFQNHSANTVNNTVTSLVIGNGGTDPAGSNAAPSNGDLVVIAVGIISTAAATDPTSGSGVTISGFTQAYKGYDTTWGVQYTVLYKFAGASEPASYTTATWTNASKGAGWTILDYSGCVSSPSPVIAGQNNAYGSGMALPSVTPGGSTWFLVGVGIDGIGQGSTYTTPSGMTQRVNFTSASSAKVAMWCGDQQLVSSSATGTKTVATSVSVASGGVQMVFAP